MTAWKKFTELITKDHKKMILFFVLLAVPIVTFLLLASEVSHKRFLPFDVPILLFIHDYTSSLLTTFFLAVTHLGDSVMMLIVATILAAYYAYKKVYQKALILLVSMGGIIVANSILKFIFQRDRPTLWQHLVDETNFSFPSGHAMISAGFATVLVVLFWNTKYRWTTVVLALVGMLLVGLSRLYLGVHYPSDILAGWCVSVAWVILVAVGIKYFYPERLDKSI